MTKKAEKPARKIGRPSLYSEELGEEICARVAAGEDIMVSGLALGGKRTQEPQPVAYSSSYKSFVLTPSAPAMVVRD